MTGNMLETEKYRKMVENANQAIFVVQDGKLVYLNPITVDMIGYSREELMAVAFTEFLHPDDRGMIVDRHLRRLQGEKLPQGYPFRVIRRDGSIRWVELNAVFMDWNGRPATLNYLRDISERKWAEAELCNNEARLRSLVRILQHPSEEIQEFLDYALNEAIALTQSRLGYIYFYNEEQREFTLNTWSRDVMEECAVAEPRTIYKLDQTGIWGEAVRQRKPILVNDFEAFHPEKKGYPEGHVELFRFLTVPVLRGDRIVAVVGVGNRQTPYTETDILQLTLLMDAVRKETDRRETENNLHEREKTYRALFDSIRDPLLIADRGRCILDCNPAFTELFGYRLSEIKGRETAVIYDKPEQYEEMGRALKEAVGLKEMVAAVDFKKQSGESFPGEVKISYLKDMDDQVAGVLGQIRDLSERQRAEVERSELEAQFRQAQKLEAVGRLTGGVAHDFNNLLAVMNGYADLLLMDMEEESPLKKKALQIIDAGKKAASLIRQLMAFSRRQVLQTRIVNFNTILQGLEKMLPRIIGEDISLGFVLEKDLGNVKADPSQIEQVIMNLAVNARDAMLRGGRLTIETHNVNLDESYAGRHPEVMAGPHVMLAVSDTGAGMDRATMEQIFDPFFTTKAPGTGTGLGLSTVYGIVRQHGGHIRVYSELGRGAVFKIYFSRVEDVTKSTEIAAEPATQRGCETVLLVEDDAFVRELIETMLQSVGYNVITAADGEEALHAGVRSETLHLLLTDLIMPGMSGLDLAERMREFRPHIRVLYMSGYTDEAIVRHGILEKEAPFIQKPFPLKMLTAKVRTVLDTPAA